MRYERGSINDHQLLSVVALMLKPNLLNFDDLRGLHYRDNEIFSIMEQMIGELDGDVRIGKNTQHLDAAWKAQIPNMKLDSVKELNFQDNVSLSEINNSILKLDRSINGHSSKSKITLTHGRVISELLDSVTNNLVRLNVNMSDFNRADIKFFVGSRFRNSGNRQMINLGTNYIDPDFFLKNSVNVIKCMRAVGKDFKIDENAMTKILAEEFPGIYSYHNG